MGAAAGAQILGFIESLPEGWDTVVGERGLKLSGGEKQRVSIARCLLKDPPLVILDEATSALDTRTERSVLQALTSLRENRTMLVIAHRLSTIKDVDQIIVLGKGNIKEKGTHEELMPKQEDYFTMWNTQFMSAAKKENNLDGDQEDLLIDFKEGKDHD